MSKTSVQKFPLAVKVAVDSLDPKLLQAASLGRKELYKALYEHGLAWDSHVGMWAAALPKRTKFVDTTGKPTGRVTIRITTHKDLMNAVSERIERSLVKRGSRIITSSNFVKSRRGEHVHVFITAQWPNEEENEE